MELKYSRLIKARASAARTFPGRFPSAAFGSRTTLTTTASGPARLRHSVASRRPGRRRGRCTEAATRKALVPLGPPGIHLSFRFTTRGVSSPLSRPGVCCAVCVSAEGDGLGRGGMALIAACLLQLFIVHCTLYSIQYIL